MKNDIVIELLKYGYDNIHHGIEKDKTIKHLFGLRKSRFWFSKRFKSLEDIKYIVNTYFDRNFYIPQDGSGKDIGNKYFLNPDGYFRYLQHKSIVITRSYSTIAIIIAIISIVFSLFNNKPVSLSESQMNTFVLYDSISNNTNNKINANLNEIKVEISNIQSKIDTVENIKWKILK